MSEVKRHTLKSKFEGLFFGDLKMTCPGLFTGAVRRYLNEKARAGWWRAIFILGDPGIQI